MRGGGRAEVGSVNRSSPYRNKNSGNGKNGKIDTILNDPIVPYNSGSSPYVSNKEERTGKKGKIGQKGLVIQMSLLTCSILQFLLVYYPHTTCHHLRGQRLNTALLLNIISPTLEYSPENFNKDIEELDQYESLKNRSHGRNEKLFSSNPEEPFDVQNERDNFKDSIIVNLQNWHEIYHESWKQDDMKRATMESPEKRKRVFIEKELREAKTKWKELITNINLESTRTSPDSSRTIGFESSHNDDSQQNRVGETKEQAH